MAERWLLPGNRCGNLMTTRQLSRLFHQAADAAGDQEGSDGTRCATASPPICSSAAPILELSKRCSVGARIGITAVLHSRGSAMTHHPHVHMMVPGGGISLDVY
jgi:hypothetical protein